MQINCPLFVYVGRRKIYLNLNTYRNLYYQINNKAKAAFKNEIYPQIKKLPTMQQISIDYILYPATLRKCDIANICCIVDKFFSDALVEAHKLPDDNYENLQRITYSIGEVDRKNPRCEARITVLPLHLPLAD